jgi:hypothetical protein
VGSYRNVVRFWNATTGLHQGSLMILLDGSNKRCVLTVSPEGHWCGSEGVEKLFVYPAKNKERTMDYALQEFAEKFQWKNDPSKVRMLGK